MASWKDWPEWPIWGSFLVLVNAVIASFWPAFDPMWTHRFWFVLISLAIAAGALIAINYTYRKQEERSAGDRLLWRDILTNVLAIRSDREKVRVAPPQTLKSKAYNLAIRIREFLERRYAERGALTIDSDEARDGTQEPHNLLSSATESLNEYLEVRNQLRATFPHSSDAFFKERYARPRYDHDLFQIAAGMERLADQLLTAEPSR
jgi:hypothetical protein